MKALFYADLRPFEEFHHAIYECDWGSKPLPRVGDFICMDWAVEHHAKASPELQEYLDSAAAQSIDWSGFELIFVDWQIATDVKDTEIRIHLAFREDEDGDED